MTAATLLPDLMTRSARSMREALQELESPALSSQEATHLVMAILGQAEGLRAVGESTRAAFEGGLNGADARAVAEVNWMACSLWLALLEDVRGLVSGVAPRGDWAVNLDRAIAEADVAKAKASKLRDFLAQPPPPYDPQALKRAQEAHARGERGEDLPALLARLEAGGEI